MHIGSTRPLVCHAQTIFPLSIGMFSIPDTWSSLNKPYLTCRSRNIPNFVQNGDPGVSLEKSGRGASNNF